MNSLHLLAIFAIGLPLAVTITLYVSSSFDCSGAVAYTCSNIAEGTCYSNGQKYGSALFSGLPTAGVPAQGVTYNINNGNSCGTSCNSGYGLNLCLACNQQGDPSGPYLDGANWIQVAGKRNIQDSDGCEPILPDTMTFANGRKFRINYDVPANVTQTLMALVEADPGLERGVGEELRLYEIMD